MKQILVLIVLIVGLLACSVQKKAAKEKAGNVEVTVQDSLEYDVETFDQKFETWYAVQNVPSKYRSQEYYERWNREYVVAWNNRCSHPDPNWHFEPVVGYNPAEDYGFEMNHKLFYYFMYVENVLKITIISGGPKTYEPLPGS